MEVTAKSNGHAVTRAEFDCASCGHHFPRGDGGETGGMCEPCFDAELRKAHEQLAKSRAKAAGDIPCSPRVAEPFQRVRSPHIIGRRLAS
jgi:hypothetical protein